MNNPIGGWWFTEYPTVTSVNLSMGTRLRHSKICSSVPWPQSSCSATARVCTSVASLVMLSAVPGGPDMVQACAKGTPRSPP